MNTYRLTFFVLLIIGFVVSLSGQRKSDPLIPKWISNPPVSNNKNYQFKSVYIDNGSDLVSSRALIKAELINSIERDMLITVDEVAESNSTTTEDSRGSFRSQSTSTYELKVKSEGNPVNIRCEKIDEYWVEELVGNHKVFKLYTLFLVAQRQMGVRFDTYSVSTSYGIDALWRSAVAPGWGQFYKGSNGKGYAIIGGEVLFIGGIIVAESLRSNYIRLATSTNNAIHQRSYLLDADNWETVRNISIGGAVAVYVYNLIDALAAKGAKRIVTNPHLSVQPFLSNKDFGVSFAYQF